MLKSKKKKQKKATLIEIKKNLQGNNSRVDEAKNQINDLKHKEAKNKQSEQEEEKRSQKKMRIVEAKDLSPLDSRATSCLGPSLFDPDHIATVLVSVLWRCRTNRRERERIRN